MHPHTQSPVGRWTCMSTPRMAADPGLDLETLERVQRRVLWLATSIVHHANRVRPNRSGVKVGGHQASSASMVSLMTALYFAHLEAPDRVSVKPHASPVLHAINYLLGRLDRRYLTTLREFGGLQSYPSRTKDPDPVDYSTGSVGIGATATIWGALAHRYVAGHFEVPRGGRQIALLGDAELDEGAVWEAVVDPLVARLGAAVAARLQRAPVERHAPPRVPASLGRAHTGTASTQQALGRLFVDLDHEAPEVAAHVVTVAPDVASSTNLGGWINRSGIWNLGERIDWFADDSDTLVRWRESDHGQHVELGIAEVNLVGLLGELGATWSRDGQPLLPVGTIYDPFVARAHEPWSFGIYAGGQSILVGTPSGVTLGPEGGAHQSGVTPSIGIEQPGCVAWEPAFGRDFEWAFLHALSQLGRPDGESAYFRLSTRPVDQALAGEARREDVLAGGYRLRPRDGAAVTIAAMGAVVPEALAAAEEIDADVVCVTSADLLFRALQARAGLGEGDPSILDRLFGGAPRP